MDRIFQNHLIEGLRPKEELRVCLYKLNLFVYGVTSSYVCMKVLMFLYLIEGLRLKGALDMWLYYIS